MTQNLIFSSRDWNDLTPRGSFLGLVEGDYWWLEAYKQNPRFTPPIVGEATNRKVLHMFRQT